MQSQAMTTPYRLTPAIWRNAYDAVRHGSPKGHHHVNRRIMVHIPRTAPEARSSVSIVLSHALA
jgi:hypothetical protein